MTRQEVMDRFNRDGGNVHLWGVWKSCADVWDPVENRWAKLCGEGETVEEAIANAYGETVSDPWKELIGQ